MLGSKIDLDHMSYGLQPIQHAEISNFNDIAANRLLVSIEEDFWLLKLSSDSDSLSLDQANDKSLLYEH